MKLDFPQAHHAIFKLNRGDLALFNNQNAVISTCVRNRKVQFPKCITSDLTTVIGD